MNKLGPQQIFLKTKTVLDLEPHAKFSFDF